MNVSFVGLFVVLCEDNKLRYDSQIIYGARYPENNQKDISGLCKAMNSELHTNYKFVDMFGVLKRDGTVLWQEDEDKTYVPEEFVPPELKESTSDQETSSSLVDFEADEMHQQ